MGQSFLYVPLSSCVKLLVDISTFGMAWYHPPEKHIKSIHWEGTQKIKKNLITVKESQELWTSYSKMMKHH
jgi:hypothetical protein